MPIFRYTVASKEGKKLSGSIEALNEEQARNELNALGFSILEIKAQEQSQSPSQKGISKLIFEAKNPQGQTVNGTIAAIDDYLAFKRLTQEYELTVTAIWPEEADDLTIQNAKIRGTRHMKERLEDETKEKETTEQIKSQEYQKRELIIHTKVEEVLKQVSSLLVDYQQYISPDQKREIDKRIDKLLRIKNSTNLDYIVMSTEDLLAFIREQEKVLKEKGFLDKRTKLQIRIKEMLSNLHQSTKPKSLSEDIVGKIQKWQQHNVKKASKPPFFVNFINHILIKIKKFFETPEEIIILKEKIRTYNVQIMEYIKMYFREPAKEYKEKVRRAIKAIWISRKKTVKLLKETRKNLKEAQKREKKESGFKEFWLNLLEDITEFTGWLLAFYLIYYFVSLYLSSKNFGIISEESIPKSLQFNKTQIFKYALVIIFLAHCAFSIKVNFFKQNKYAGIVIFPIMIFVVVLTFVNF